MDFTPTEDQEELRANVRSVLSRTCPTSVVRQVFEDKGAASAELWARIVELGWPALTIPEESGGLGLGFVELALVAEEMGRVVAPSPWAATVTQFVPMVRHSEGGTSAWLRQVAEGSITGTIAVAEDSGRWDPATMATTARRARSGWVLDGIKSFVFDGVTADEIAVVARAGEDGLGVFVVPGPSVDAAPLPVIDPTQPLARLTLDSVEVPADRILVEPGDPTAGPAVRRAIEEATAAVAVSTTGTCRAIFETTLQYTKDREQYGRPIGSFQALKHRLVDMYLALERASALAAFAALTIAEDDERRSLAVAMAKAASGDCQRLMVEDGLQLHGGIGFTWENDLHMFLKRAKSGDLLFGTSATHRAAVARHLGVGA